MIECECTSWGCEYILIGDEHHPQCPKHPSHARVKVQCLICDKELDYEPGPNHNGNVYDGGFMLLSFHYGSRHDQCHGWAGRKDSMVERDGTPLNNMLACDEIEAFICDDCFEKKLDKMKGYDIHTKRTRMPRTGA